MRGSDAPEGRLVQAWREGKRGWTKRSVTRGGGSEWPRRGGAGGGGRRRSARGHKVTWGWGGASLRLGRGQSPHRAALQRLSSETTQVLPRSSEDKGAWKLRRSGGLQAGTWGPEGSHRAGGRATCPGGQVSRVPGGGRRALWETKPEVGIAGSQTLAGLERGRRAGALQGRERKGRLLRAGGGAQVWGSLKN